MSETLQEKRLIVKVFTIFGKVSYEVGGCGVGGDHETFRIFSRLSRFWSWRVPLTQNMAQRA